MWYVICCRRFGGCEGNERETLLRGHRLPGGDAYGEMLQYTGEKL